MCVGVFVCVNYIMSSRHLTINFQLQPYNILYNCYSVNNRDRYHLRWFLISYNLCKYRQPPLPLPHVYLHVTDHLDSRFLC